LIRTSDVAGDEPGHTQRLAERVKGDVLVVGSRKGEAEKSLHQETEDHAVLGGLIRNALSSSLWIYLGTEIIDDKGANDCAGLYANIVRFASRGVNEEGNRGIPGRKR